MRCDRVQRKRVGGFTLLEALTVMVIIVILTSIAVALYSTHHRAARAKSAARKLEALFTTARTLAINQNTYFQAVIDQRTSGLWIDQIDENDEIVAPKITTPETLPQFVTITSATVNGVAPDGDLVRIRFNPDGTSDSAQIVLLSEGADSRSAGEYVTVTLYSSTARSRSYVGERRLGEGQ